MVTIELVKKYQELWANGIVEIGKAYLGDRDYLALASSLVDSLYAYDLGPVLFKPTKAEEVPFRSDKEAALSYFVAENGRCEEDAGFALQPWIEIRFDNHQIVTQEKSALAMGHYFFTDAIGDEIQVEYSFSYLLDDKGGLKINLHHSSLPFSSSGSCC